MYNREEKRPRISRNAGHRDENRQRKPDTREGDERANRFNRERRDDFFSGEGESDRPVRRFKRVEIRDLNQEREGKFVRQNRFDRGERNDEGERFRRDRYEGDRDGERKERSFRRRDENYQKREEQGERRENRFPRRESREDRNERYTSDRENRSEGGERRFQQRNYREESGKRNEFRRGARSEREEYNRGEREERNDRFNRVDRPNRERRNFPEARERKRSVYSQKKQLAHRLENEGDETELRLNRYIAKGGICSRRDADELILAGRVKVNGEVIQQVGVKVKREDRVEVDDRVVVPERKVYLVLNKPKDYVTTVDDPMERKTVMSLIEGACKERVYPVGRLDRQTTGVLLFTNDGDLAKKLTHPKYNQKKIYHVFLDKVVSMGDIQSIRDGIELEDGFVQADDIQIAADDRTQVGIEIHSGKNRIVRRIFEHFGYQILRLDRVYFAGITKKNLPRGRRRFLTPEEVTVLKVY